MSWGLHFREITLAHCVIWSEGRKLDTGRPIEKGFEKSRWAVMKAWAIVREYKPKTATYMHIVFTASPPWGLCLDWLI